MSSRDVCDCPFRRIEEESQETKVAVRQRLCREPNIANTSKLGLLDSPEPPAHQMLVQHAQFRHAEVRHRIGVDSIQCGQQKKGVVTHRLFQPRLGTSNLTQARHGLKCHTSVEADLHASSQKGKIASLGTEVFYESYFESGSVDP